MKANNEKKEMRLNETKGVSQSLCRDDYGSLNDCNRASNACSHDDIMGNRYGSDRRIRRANKCLTVQK